MPRSYKSTAVYQKPDPRFGSRLCSKVINRLMLDGKKSVAQRILYEAIDLVAEKVQDEPLEIITKAVENCSPRIEVRSRRVGGATYQVPREVQRKRSQSLGIRWLVDHARAKRGKPMARRLAEELFDAYNNQGSAVQKKDNVHKMAEANSAYSHFAF